MTVKAASFPQNSQISRSRVPVAITWFPGTVLYPIDTIKTRLQHMTQGGGLSALVKGSGSGMSKLYSGLIGNLVGVAPASGVFFMAYEPFKKEAKKYCPEDIAPFFAGALAGIAASIIRVPTEVVKQRMQTKEFSTAINAVWFYVALYGVRKYTVIPVLKSILIPVSCF